MALDEVLEQRRQSTLAYMRNHIAVLECEIARRSDDIVYWSRVVETSDDPLWLETLNFAKAGLERAKRDREFYVARIASFEGFALVRSDVH